ncbi:unnamed protein product, partial [Brassica oleracea]
MAEKLQLIFILALYKSSYRLSSHLWWLSLSPCLPVEIWIMFSFVYAMWAWKVI